MRSLDDARLVSIELTPRGHRLIDKAPPPYQERLKVQLRTMPENELLAIARSLEILNRAAGWEKQKPRLFFETSPKSKK